MFDLQLAIGVRPVKASEYPEGYNVEEINNTRNQANITQGYKLFDAPSGAKHTHFLEVNVNIEKLWPLFLDITTKLFPDNSYGVITHFGEEKPKISNGLKTTAIVTLFKEFEFELVHDGFLGFGIAHYDETTLNEVFVENCKYLKIWTSKIDELLEILHNYELREIPDLKFIDEFPVVREGLTKCGYPDAKSHEFVFNYIGNEFHASYRE